MFNMYKLICFYIIYIYRVTKIKIISSEPQMHNIYRVVDCIRYIYKYK